MESRRVDLNITQGLKQTYQALAENEIRSEADFNTFFSAIVWLGLLQAWVTFRAILLFSAVPCHVFVSALQSKIE